MSETIEVRLRKPHTGQRIIIEDKKRFNTVCCGRRFGKTELAQELLLEEYDESNGAIAGFPVAYFAPTYKMLSEVWRNMLIIAAPLIIDKNVQEKRIELITGGSIDFWSLDNIDSVRGRKYKRVILDEAAMISNLKEAWEESLRPLLADLVGDAFFFSTPRGKGNYFYELFNNKEKHDNWQSFQMPTSANPFIDKQEIEEARNLLPAIVFSQEYLAEFTQTNFDHLFIYSLREENMSDKNPGYSHITSGMLPDYKLPLILSFDYNVEPITCLAIQHGQKLEWVKILQEYRLLNSDIFELCQRIRTDHNGAFFMVTGDASGRNRTAITKGNRNYYQIIQQELMLMPRQVLLPNKNPSVHDSRVLSNALLAKHPDYKINESCRFFIEDLRSLTTDEKGNIDKNKDAHKSHLADCFLYYNYVFHNRFLPSSMFSNKNNVQVNNGN